MSRAVLPLPAPVGFPCIVFVLSIAVFKKPGYGELREKQRSQGDVIPVTVVCDNIRDPGNMGSLLRSLSAAGCQEAIMLRRNQLKFMTMNETGTYHTVCLNELVSRAQARTGAKLSLCLEYGGINV